MKLNETEKKIRKRMMEMLRMSLRLMRKETKRELQFIHHLDAQRTAYLLSECNLMTREKCCLLIKIIDKAYKE